MTLSVNDRGVLDFAVPASADYEKPVPLSLDKIYLESGTNVLMFSIKNNGISLFYVDFVLEPLYRTIYVSPQGNDSADGSKKSPFKTLKRAKEEVEKINAQSSLYNGVDSHTCALLKYKSGAIADISSAILLRKPNEGFIYGSNGYAYLKRFYAPQEIEINLNNGETEIIPTPYAGNGFEEQIKHVCECVEKGLTESPVVTPEQTLYITEQMDTIRKITGVIYPQDK